MLQKEEDTMTIVSHLVWSMEDTCHDTIEAEFSRPANEQTNNVATTSAQVEDETIHSVDTIEVLENYFEQTTRRVAEFTETLLYSILFLKWAESNNGTTSTSPSKWKESLPDELRRATRAKANRMVNKFAGLTRIRLAAIDHVYFALQRAEQLTFQYIQRKGDRILDPSSGDDEQEVEMGRMETDAVNYVNRQMRTQLEMHQTRANEEMFEMLTDEIDESIENTEYCEWLHNWAEATVGGLAGSGSGLMDSTDSTDSDPANVVQVPLEAEEQATLVRLATRNDDPIKNVAPVSSDAEDTYTTVAYDDEESTMNSVRSGRCKPPVSVVLVEDGDTLCSV